MEPIFGDSKGAQGCCSSLLPLLGNINANQWDHHTVWTLNNLQPYRNTLEIQDIAGLDSKMFVLDHCVKEDLKFWVIKNVLCVCVCV